MLRAKIPIKWFNIPNAITSIRLLIFPVIWLFAVQGNRTTVAILVLLCLLTDFFDGLAARLLNQQTSFGAKLDSTADNLMLLSIVFWIGLTVPELWASHPILLGILFLLLVIVFSIMAVKFGRNVEIHTYLSKLGVTVMWTFFIHSLLLGVIDIFFYVFIVTSFLYLLEDIYLLLTRETLDEHEKGLLFR